MFSFLQSEQSKLRQAAKHWLYIASKTYNFRKDELSDGDVSELESSIERLRSKMKDKSVDSGTMKLALDDIEAVMRRLGGVFYPRSSIGENVDFFFVALIIYLGVTTFFVKPFKIPTNSMWPTYHGMTAEVWKSEEEKPSLLARPLRLAAFGATRYEVRAPADGELMMPVYGSAGSGYDFFHDVVSKRRFFVLPGQGYRYTFQVGAEPVELIVPRDFSLGKQVVLPALFPEEESPSYLISKLRATNGSGGRLKANVARANGTMRAIEVPLVKTGKFFKKGETIFSFDILTGDQLFVDRMSYNFVSPKTGDGFVFRTNNIDGIGKDSFYIKRLVGTPGDQIRIEEGGLVVNGEDASGSIAFDYNRDKTPPYAGYNAIKNLAPGRDVSVPDDRYYALGDNSYNSLDSRYWGFVPEEDVVGRPLVIYYPFTKRFGPVK